MNGKEFVGWYHQKFTSPYPDSQWPTCVADHNALVSLIEAHGIASVLEIGTWAGYTAMMLWLHPQMQRVAALDTAGTDPEYAHHFHGRHPSDFYGQYFRHTPVQLLVGNTQTVAPQPGWDMIYIDGDHRYEWARRDTLWALECKPKLIAWHDRHNGNPGVDQWLDEFQQTRPCEQVPGSVVVYHRP